MPQKIRGELTVSSTQRYALVVAEFNSFITNRLAEAAIDCLQRHGAADTQIVEFRVPGSFEIPTVARQLALSGKYSAVICLGCVIRGQTGHYEHVTHQVSRGVGVVGPETLVPTIFGVITADTMEQAVDRAGLKAGNAGWSAACTAIEMANLMGKIKNDKL